MLRSLFGRYRHRTVMALALVTSVILMSLDQNRRVEIARGLGATLYAPLHSVVQGAEELLLLRRENRQLRRVVATLNLERMRLLQLRDERLQMRRIAGFAAERFPILLPCEVVGRSTDHLQDMLQLARGATDSIQVDMPVTAYAGLVGRVRQVSSNRAVVEVLTSPGMVVSCRDQRSGVVGTLRWIRGNRLSLDRVDAVEDVLVGDPLVTSGLGGIYPRGIPVGVVTRVESSLDGLFKQIEVQPYAEIGGLQDVFVVRRLVDWEDEALYSPEETALLRGLEEATHAARAPRGD